MSPRSLFILPFLATTSFLALAPADASTLAPLPESCFSYSFSNTSSGAHSFAGIKLHATLPGTPLVLDVQHVTLRDSKDKLDGPTLERFNAAAAYAALTAFRGGLSPACHNQGTTIRNDSLRGGAPDALWTSVHLLKQDGHDLSLASAHIETVESTPDIRLRITGQGIHASKQPLAPRQFSTDLTIQGAGSPAQQISINALHALVDTSAIDGKGLIQPGTSAASSSANLHIEITDIASLIQDIQQTAPAKVTTALSIARLMGHNSGNTTAWDVALQNGLLTVNHIPMPVAIR